MLAEIESKAVEVGPKFTKSAADSAEIGRIGPEPISIELGPTSTKLARNSRNPAISGSISVELGPNMAQLRQTSAKFGLESTEFGPMPTDIGSSWTSGFPMSAMFVYSMLGWRDENHLGMLAEQSHKSRRGDARAGGGESRSRSLAFQRPRKWEAARRRRETGPGATKRARPVGPDREPRTGPAEKWGVSR